MRRGLDLYRRSVQLANQYRKPHQRIQHTMQTNGTLVDDEWAAFFKENNDSIRFLPLLTSSVSSETARCGSAPARFVFFKDL
jgi:hypothetical protein